MEESGRIKGLSMYYESNFEYLKRGLMLRYVNGDVSFDIEKKIDLELEILKENPDRTDDYKKSYADLTYWKYKFLKNFVFGKTRKRYAVKKYIFKQKINSAKAILK